MANSETPVNVTLSSDASAILRKLVREHGFAKEEYAIHAALEMLLEEVSAGDDEEVLAALMEAEEDRKRGIPARPMKEVFDEIRRDYGIPPVA